MANGYGFGRDAFGINGWGFIGLMLSGLIVIGALAAFAYTNVNGNTCNIYGDRTGMDVEWSFWGGCYVEIEDGVYVPKGDDRIDDYRVTITNENENEQDKPNGKVGE